MDIFPVRNSTRISLTDSAASMRSYLDPTPAYDVSPSPSNASIHRGQRISVNLEACRQAFLAVLASVCDPHLNTIHAVCAKFSESRGGPVSLGSLLPPRPVDRPLNSAILHPLRNQMIDPFHHGTSEMTGAVVADDWESLFNFAATYLSPAEYIPDLGNAGALSVPGLEPPHPVNDFELAAADAWAEVLRLVDISKTDVEDLASRLTAKIRCYGFGPVLMHRDVVHICQGV